MRFTLFILTLVFAFISCSEKGNNDKREFIGFYKEKKIYTDQRDTMKIVEAVQKSMIDLENYKLKDNQYYSELIRSAKEEYLVYSLFYKNVDKNKSKYQKIVSFKYELQHIFVNEPAQFNELLLYKEKMNDFNGFAELAEKYSKEISTKTRQGVHSFVTIFNNKVSPAIFYELYGKKEKDLLIFEDAYGYHFIRILKKENYDIMDIITKTNNMKMFSVGVTDYLRDQYFEKQYKNYKVKINYENLYQILYKKDTDLIFQIGDSQYLKSDIIQYLDEEKKKDPVYATQLHMTTIAPIVQEAIQKIIIAEEAAKLGNKKDIIQRAEKNFIDDIFIKWLNAAIKSVDVSDIKDDMIIKAYKDLNVQNEQMFQLALLQFDNHESFKQVKDTISTANGFKSFMVKNPGMVQYSQELSKSKCPDIYKELILHIDKPVGTILPVFITENKKVALPMIIKKGVKPTLTIKDFKESISGVIKQERFFSAIISEWKSNKDLHLEPWVFTQYEYFLNELANNGTKRLEKYK